MRIGNVFKEGELDAVATCAKFAQVQTEGSRLIQRSVDFYNLDVIISVGYRVKSPRGTQFRMAKGSGMIHPDMATMLGYLSCDAGVPAPEWQAMVRRAVDRSFNAITVDGDTSTNDTFLAFAAGEPLNPGLYGALEAGLTAVSRHLAKAIARDGEGATCLIQVDVEGASDEAGARAIARTVCGSSLVKCAIHGRDPNWGRIVAAAGRAGVPFDPEAVALWLGTHQLMEQGQPLAFDRPAASAYLKACAAGAYLGGPGPEGDTVQIRLAVGTGPGHGSAWGCDLSDQYVRINADYTT